MAKSIFLTQRLVCSQCGGDIYFTETSISQRPIPLYPNHPVTHEVLLQVEPCQTCLKPAKQLAGAIKSINEANTAL